MGQIKKIELSEVGEGSFVNVRLRKFLEVQEFEKVIRKLSFKNEKLEILVKRLKSKVEKASDEEIESLLEKQEQMEDENSDNSFKIVAEVVGNVKANFIDGSILDNESKTLRNMTIDDIESFDTVILGKISNTILGYATKNV